MVMNPSQPREAASASEYPTLEHVPRLEHPPVSPVLAQSEAPERLGDMCFLRLAVLLLEGARRADRAPPTVQRRGSKVQAALPESMTFRNPGWRSAVVAAGDIDGLDALTREYWELTPALHTYAARYVGAHRAECATD